MILFGKNYLGFSLIEVLIILSITSIIFTSLLLLVLKDIAMVEKLYANTLSERNNINYNMHQHGDYSQSDDVDNTNLSTDTTSYN